MIAVGSFVNFGGSYEIAYVVASVPAPGPDPYWLCATYGGYGTRLFQSPESNLFEISFTPWPAGFGSGDIVDVFDNGPFWAIPPGPGVKIGRGMLVYPVNATNPLIGSFDGAWVQLEAGNPAIFALYSGLTIVRKFGAPIP